MSEQSVDEQARELAIEATNRINIHEARCTERWARADQTMARVDGNVQGLTVSVAALTERIASAKNSTQRIILNGMGAAILALLGICGFLIVHVIPELH